MSDDVFHTDERNIIAVPKGLERIEREQNFWNEIKRMEKIMELEVYLLVVAAVLVVFAYSAIQSKKSAVLRMNRRIKEQWGNFSEREYEQKEYDKIADYFRKVSSLSEENSDIVDDITWNDLDMDTIFMAMNTTYSSAGEEYLYKMLRMTQRDDTVLKERDRLAEYFTEHKEQREKLQTIFYRLGRTKNISLTEFISRLYELKPKSNFMHYWLDLMFLAALVILFIKPVIGIVAIVFMLCINVGTYYNRKAEVESYFVCFQYLVRMQEAAKLIIKEENKELEEYNKALERVCKILAPIRKGAFLLASTNINGSVSEIALDYIRMITHVDLIKFNSMLKRTTEHADEVEELFVILGKIEAIIAVASFRESLAYYVKPEFTLIEKGIAFADIYHPLIPNPVVNSMQEEKCVLLTGSNASGKSTFLKTVAINAILAQTIYTCTAKAYKTAYYSIYTSMALRDNLQGQESYYIVEIKSLKRIIDNISEGKKVLCFVDEVLRGTNTVERIAASTYILKALSDHGAMCFAATHDVELTHILEKIYANYHFQEEVRDDDVLFNYQLYEGRAVSRNAIKLLKIMGYDGEIIESAENAAQNFLNTGIWENAIE